MKREKSAEENWQLKKSRIYDGTTRARERSKWAMLSQFLILGVEGGHVIRSYTPDLVAAALLTHHGVHIYNSHIVTSTTVTFIITSAALETRDSI